MSALTEERITDKLLIVSFTVLEDELKCSIEIIGSYSDEEMMGKVQCNLCDYIDTELAFRKQASELIGQKKAGRPPKTDQVYVCPNCLQYKSFCLFKEENFIKDE